MLAFKFTFIALLAIFALVSLSSAQVPDVIGGIVPKGESDVIDVDALPKTAVDPKDVVQEQQLETVLPETIIELCYTCIYFTLNKIVETENF